MPTDMFLPLVCKYAHAHQLAPRTLNELIEKIKVYQATKIEGVWG